MAHHSLDLRSKLAVERGLQRNCLVNWALGLRLYRGDRVHLARRGPEDGIALNYGAPASLVKLYLIVKNVLLQFCYTSAMLMVHAISAGFSPIEDSSESVLKAPLWSEPFSWLTDTPGSVGLVRSYPEPHQRASNLNYYIEQFHKPARLQYR